MSSCSRATRWSSIRAARSNTRACAHSAISRRGKNFIKDTRIQRDKLRKQFKTGAKRFQPRFAPVFLNLFSPGRFPVPSGGRPKRCKVDLLYKPSCARAWASCLSFWLLMTFRREKSSRSFSSSTSAMYLMVLPNWGIMMLLSALARFCVF